MSYDLIVTIHDEMDPVLAVVTGGSDVIPLVYKDYRGSYDRPESSLSIRDFAEWVVAEFGDGLTIVSSTILDGIEYQGLHDDEAFVRMVRVTCTS